MTRSRRDHAPTRILFTLSPFLVLGISMMFMSLPFSGMGRSAQFRQIETRTTVQDQRRGAANIEEVEQLITNWSDKARELANRLIDKYGEPNEATESRLIWHNNGQWRMTELVNEEIPHNFPVPHQDMLYQEVTYKVPPDKFDELARYDGSVLPDRTKGVLGARCNTEEANILAINLAHDIITGKRTVDEARRYYAQAVVEKKHPDYMKDFAFDMPKMRGPVGDPDEEFDFNERNWRND